MWNHDKKKTYGFGKKQAGLVPTKVKTLMTLFQD